MKILKSKNGITLLSLVITIIVMLILLVSISVNYTQTAELRRFSAVKQDIITLSEEVRRYYSVNGTLPISGTKEFNVNSTYKNPNDNEIYYIIDIEQLINFDSSLSIENPEEEYIVNEQSLTVYFSQGVTFGNQIYYTVVDSFNDSGITTDYYSKTDLPIISVVTLESSGENKTRATVGDTVTLRMLKNYELTTQPTVTINGQASSVTWNENVGTATYTITIEDMLNKENELIDINISGYSAGETVGTPITGVTFGSGVSIYAKIYTVKDVKKEAASFYGAYLSNYTSENDQYIKDGEEGEYWKIFYSDNSHIYLITSNYIHYNAMPIVMVNGVEKNAQVTYTENGETLVYQYRGKLTNVIDAYTGTSDIAENVRYLNKNYFELLNGSNANQGNTQAIAYMLDTVKWSNFAGANSDFAIGGPSLELLFDSYNDKYYPVARNLVAGSITANQTTGTDTITTNGYNKLSSNEGTTWQDSIIASYDDSLYFIGDESSNKNNAYSYFISSPSSKNNLHVFNTNYGKRTTNTWYGYDYIRFSPCCSPKFRA